MKPRKVTSQRNTLDVENREFIRTSNRPDSGTRTDSQNKISDEKSSLTEKLHNRLSSSKMQKKTAGKNKHRSDRVWFSGVPEALVKQSRENANPPAKGLVKAESFSGMTKAIALDCEFVGVGFEGKEDALARVSIVNQFGHVLLDEYVRPKEKITDYRTAVSGITPHHMRPGGPAKDFDTVHTNVAALCKGRVLVGHAVHNDLRVLMLSHPKMDIRDTSRYKPFRNLFNGRNPSLKALTDRVLGISVQAGEHDSVEDARATMRIYTAVKRIWEAQLKARRAGKPAKEIRRLSEHLRFPSASGEPNDTDEKRLKPTPLARIALDVASEFAVGVPLGGCSSGTQKTKKNVSLTLSSKMPGPVTKGRRRCSKRHEQVIAKRRRMRQRKFLPSSATVTSLFS
uniref:RNA exonuclease 4 n=1 Tax=Mesocestoides corti TaxID=53468 RepID=A0A5K3EIS8_MESCO